MFMAIVWSTWKHRNRAIFLIMNDLVQTMVSSSMWMRARSRGKASASLLDFLINSGWIGCLYVCYSLFLFFTRFNTRVEFNKIIKHKIKYLVRYTFFCMIMLSKFKFKKSKQTSKMKTSNRLGLKTLYYIIIWLCAIIWQDILQNLLFGETIKILYCRKTFWVLKIY